MFEGFDSLLIDVQEVDLPPQARAKAPLGLITANTRSERREIAARPGVRSGSRTQPAARTPWGCRPQPQIGVGGVCSPTAAAAASCGDGADRISWAAATYPAVDDFLTNPCYAGAFVLGRNRSEKRIDPDGRVITRTVVLPREESVVLIPEHHPGFIDCATYEANTVQLRENWRPPRGVMTCRRKLSRYAPGPFHSSILPNWDPEFGRVQA